MKTIWSDSGVTSSPTSPPGAPWVQPALETTSPSDGRQLRRRIPATCSTPSATGLTPFPRRAQGNRVIPITFFLAVRRHRATSFLDSFVEAPDLSRSDPAGLQSEGICTVHKACKDYGLAIPFRTVLYQKRSWCSRRTTQLDASPEQRRGIGKARRSGFRDSGMRQEAFHTPEDTSWA
jgi:hypothetical protein